MQRRFFVVALGAASLFLSSCAPKAAPEITVENGVFRLPAPGQTTGSVYFDIINKGSADILVSASTPVSTHVELHTHIHENNIMRMRQVDSVDAPANVTTSFKRGGLHVMVFEVNIAANATGVPLTLNFAKSGAITITTQIDNGMPAKMDHSKMGHGN